MLAYSGKRSISKLLVALLILSMMIMSMPITSQAAVTSTLYGYSVNYGGNGKIDMRWQNSNLGNSWAEGEWVPYQFVISGIKSNYGTIQNMPEIVIKYEFYKKTPNGNRFVDLVRGFQVKATSDVLSAKGVNDFMLQSPTTQGQNVISYGDQGWPHLTTPITFTDFDGMEDAQNYNGDLSAEVWPGFSYMAVPTTQINLGTPSGYDPVTKAYSTFAPLQPMNNNDPNAYLRITDADLVSAGVPNDADTIVIYFQLHLSRTSLWSSGLYQGYAIPTNPAYHWGGWVYGEPQFDLPGGTPITQLGSFYNPGSSGDARLDLSGQSGEKTVSIPVPKQPLASVEGYKWHDINGNRMKDGDEPFLANWPIYVSAEIDGMSFVLKTLTDANGKYTFPTLTYGMRYITEAANRPGESGWEQTSPHQDVAPQFSVFEEFESETLGKTFDSYEDYINDSNVVWINGDQPVELGPYGYEIELSRTNFNVTGLNFGNRLFATKSGTKIHDLNANGVFDEDEPGLEGWTIFVDYNGNGELDEGEPFDVTDEDGFYEITGIMPGTFDVIEVMEEGWFASFPVDGVYEDHLFVGGVSYPDNDFLNYTTATKSGTKFHDLNADGLFDEGEPGLEGWTIFVDYNGNGELDDDEPFDITDEDGFYEITGILPGTYDVVEEMQTGWFASFPEDGIYADHEFISGEDYEDNDFFNFTTATKSGTKFHDLNANGEFDEGEPGLEGWTIFVDYNGNGELDDDEPFDITDEDGFYEITGILPGTYDVVEEMQTGWFASFPEDGIYADHEFISGEDYEDNDFFNFTTATKSGTKFHDLNANGVFDEGEPGLEGWTIFVDYNGNGELDDDEPFDITDEDGFYEITGILPGTYDVREIMQTGWFASFPLNGVYLDHEFESGEDYEDNDFFNYTMVLKTETAWARMFDDPEDFTFKFEGHSWFTYLITKPTAEVQTFYFYAAQHYRVGEVEIEKSGDNLVIRIIMDSGFSLVDSKVNVQTSFGSFSSPAWAPGLYPHTGGLEFTIPWNNDWNDKDLIIAIHGNVEGNF